MSIVRSASISKVIGITVAGAAIGALGVICARTKKALAEDINRGWGGPDRSKHNTEQCDDELIAGAKKFNIPEFISKEG